MDGETIPLPTPAELEAEEKQAAAYVARLLELRKKIAGHTHAHAGAQCNAMQCDAYGRQRSATAEEARSTAATLLSPEALTVGCPSLPSALPWPQPAKLLPARPPSLS